jgi:prepilin-type N-terminal cleavage/methylation domain-containing protein
MTRAEKRAKLGEDEGFTLIELMVVVLIIAILIAVAIPTYIGARKSAQNSAAAQLLRNVMQTGRDIYTAHNGFGTTVAPVTTADFSTSEPLYTFSLSSGAGSSAATVNGNPNSVGVALGSGSNSTGMIQSIEYVVYDSANLCLYALDIPSDQSSLLTANGGKLPSAGTYYTSSTASKGVCTATSNGAVPSSSSTWSPNSIAS